MKAGLREDLLCGLAGCLGIAGVEKERRPNMKVGPSRNKYVYLVLFRARRKALSLRVQFDKSSSYSLHPGMQGSVLIILSIEVILVILALLIGDDSNVFSKKKKDRWRRATE